MKVLLLNMPIRFNSWQNLEMPLGIAYIAAELEQNGFLVYVKDYEVEFFEETEFKNELNRLAPDAIGISFRSSSYASAKKICALIKEHNPHIKIILGGHHASAFPEETLEDMQADFVVRGEGEYTIPQILRALDNKSSLNGIKGLTYSNKATVISNSGENIVENLDALAFPAWHLLRIDKYVTGSILTSRGCPFSCIYCDKSISTRSVRFRSPENIYREILAFEGKYKKYRIYFVDDYFFLDKNRLSRIFDLIINNHETKFKWYCQARVDGPDITILKKARKSGCEMIIYGIESGDENELEYMNKKTTLKEAESAVRLTRKAGIKTRANFMIGFPISTYKTIDNSVRFAKRINADLYRFFIVSPLPNTILWERLEKQYPQLSGVGWDKFDFYSPSFDTVEIRKEDLVKCVMAAYFYVLKGKVLGELSIKLPWRLARLLYLVFRSARIRGNLSVIFPACVNLFLEEWLILRRVKVYERLRYIKDAFKITSKIMNAQRT